MASLDQFSRRIVVTATGVERNANALARKVALAVDQTVILATPVDTGRARSNWQVGLGGPQRDVLDPYSPGSKLGLGETANAQAAIQQGAAAVGNRQPGQDIWISNNVDYIGLLNNGSSKQAPAAFVQQAVDAGVALVKGARVVP